MKSLNIAAVGNAVSILTKYAAGVGQSRSEQLGEDILLVPFWNQATFSPKYKT